MDIIQIVIFGIIASILYITLKDLNTSFAFFLLLITGIVIFLTIFHHIGTILQLLKSLGDKANINQLYIKTIIQIIGISYLTEIGSNIVKDAGLESVALKIEMVGKLFILLLAIPIFHSLIETILGIFPLS